MYNLAMHLYLCNIRVCWYAIKLISSDRLQFQRQYQLNTANFPDSLSNTVFYFAWKIQSEAKDQLILQLFFIWTRFSNC